MNADINKKRVGIITHYYHSCNYGGLLQAYALSKRIEKLGLDAQLISYNFLEKAPKKTIIRKDWLYFARLVKYYIKRIKYTKIEKGLKRRREMFYEFASKEIKHTQQVYTDESISECQDDFDIFITGSDQVWNPDWYRDAFMLHFVPDMKKKIAYAASLGKRKVPNEKVDLYIERIKRLDSVSVREKETKEYFNELGLSTEWVLDPTLLLSPEEWDEVCPHRLIKDKYVFCYFLGDSMEHRNLVQKFAKEKRIKVVTFPHMVGAFRSCDKSFGDVKLYDATPFDFISLIKNAEYVFTDSFHASVFSSLYDKKFFVFQRVGESGMSNRIESLLTVLNNTQAFCNTLEKQDLQYIKKLVDDDWKMEKTHFNEMKNMSEEFLKKSLDI